MRLPLFPELSLVSVERDAIVVRNDGTDTIGTRTYGQPEYRMIAKLFDGDREVQDRWLALPCDLRPGDVATIAFERRAHATTLRLYHALQDVPMLEPEPWMEVTLAR